jgi:hypothetical protein
MPYFFSIHKKIAIASVGGIGLSVSAESVHHNKRPSRRGFHRSSSRRNKGKENGARTNGSFRKNNNISGGNSEKNARKARAVSFEQPVVTVSAQQPNNRWHEYSISVDQGTGDYNQSTSQFYHHPPPPQHQFAMHHHHHIQQQQHHQNSFNNSINSLNISNSNCTIDMNNSNSNIQVLANSDRCGGGTEEDWQMLEDQQRQQTFLNHNRQHTAHYKPPRI